MGTWRLAITLDSDGETATRVHVYDISLQVCTRP
jgi:hypothetical protein